MDRARRIVLSALPRHTGGGNVCFADGHVKYVKTSPTGDKSLACKTGNNYYVKPDSSHGWFQTTYPANKVLVPGQDNAGATWNFDGTPCP